MTQTLKTSERLGVVDALRGFALLAIVLLHNLEHYNLFLVPENVPAWLQIIDKYAWDILFFLFAGKAYATFSLLFGFSFYIQFHNAEKRGIDFRGRFAWRMCLLFLFAQLHALFYNGDILLLYAVVGFALIPVCKLKDKTVFWIALILLLQPYEWGRAIYAMINPDYVVSTGHFMPYAMRAQEATANGNFFEVLCSNISDGQLYSNIWQVENGRLFQTAALFMFGMLLGRRKYLIKSEESVRFWKKMLKGAVLAFIPLYCLKTFVPDLLTNPSVQIPYKIAVPSYANFAFMIILVSIFTLLWFKKEKGISAAKIAQITPIQPIQRLNKEDKRFVEGYNVVNEINDEVNLASIDWQDFENLIREIFQEEFNSSGGEVKITQASRDGGVDAVVFDPDPIRGGKIVIQAKRYTNVVGVSAVRDLYGTLMNEGAMKGILVTTSNYGNDAYEFAKGKPIQLINGAELLGLLEKHGHKAKIDLKEAKLINKGNINLI